MPSGPASVARGPCALEGCDRRGSWLCEECRDVYYCTGAHRSQDAVSHRQHCSGKKHHAPKKDHSVRKTAGSQVQPIVSKSRTERSSQLGHRNGSVTNKDDVRDVSRKASVDLRADIEVVPDASPDTGEGGEGTEAQSETSAPRTRPKACRNRCHDIICCGRSKDRDIARAIFNVIDVQGDNKVGWDEFLHFVKHSYERFPTLVASFGEDTREPIPRFRRLVLKTVLDTTAKRKHRANDYQLGDHVMDVLFDLDRTFEGRGYAAAVRQLFRKFDENDSGSVSFDEFCVALREFGFFDFNVEVHGSKLHLVEYSLFCLRLDSPVRSAAIYAAYSSAFDAILITVIVINTLVIAMEDYSDPFLVQGVSEQFTPLNQFVAFSDYVFTALYVVEFIVKVVASGFMVGRGVYLSSWWNVFDFAILLFSLLVPIVEAFLGNAAEQQEVSEFLKVLRVFRIMRPLKSITAVPQMRRLASTIVAAINALKEILFLLVLLWIIIGIILVDVLNGRLSRRCHTMTEAELLTQLVTEDGRNASAVIQNSTSPEQIQFAFHNLSTVWETTDLDRACGLHTQASHHCFRDDAERSLADDLCLSIDDLNHIIPTLPPEAATTYIWKNDTFIYNERMNFGITHFDNLGFAIISLFQISTLEGWVDIVYIVQDAFFDTLMFWVFFVIMLVCGVMMIGLILAVIEAVHSEESERMTDVKVPDWSTPAVTFDLQALTSVMHSLSAGGLRRWVDRAKGAVYRRMRRRALMLSATDLNADSKLRNKKPIHAVANFLERGAEAEAAETAKKLALLAEEAGQGRTAHPASESVDMVSKWDANPQEAKASGEATDVPAEFEVVADAASGNTPESKVASTTDSRHGHSRANIEAGNDLDSLVDEVLIEENDGRRLEPFVRCLKVVNIAQSKVMTAIMSACVVMNLVFMCTGIYVPEEYLTCQDRFNGNVSAPCQEADRDYVICVSNVVFVCIFLVELIFRWSILLSARCMSGTCTGVLWARTQEELTLLQAGYTISTPPNPKGRKRLGSADKQGDHDVLHVAKQSNNQDGIPQTLNVKRPLARTTSSVERARNSRRCTGRCRPDLRQDDADEVVELLFDAALIRKLDYVDAVVTIIAVLDLSIVNFAVGDFCTLTPAPMKTEEASFVALRAFSLLRVVRLFVNWKTMQALLRIIYESGPELLSFFVLMLIFVYMSSLLGLQLFSNKFFFDDNGYHVKWEPLVYNETCPPHAPWHHSRPYTKQMSNFDTFGDAALTTFQIWSGEDWNLVMYNAIRSGGAIGPIYFIYFMCAIFAGNWLLLNLLIAIMLSHFELSRLPAGNDGEANGITDKMALIFRTLSKQSNKLTPTVHPESSESTKFDTGPGKGVSSPQVDRLSRKLTALLSGPAHHTIESIDVDETGLIIRRNATTHLSLGLGQHSRDEDLDAKTLASIPSAHAVDNIEDGYSGGTTAGGGDVDTNTEDRNAGKTDTGGSSHHSSPWSSARIRTLIKKGHVLGTEILDHMDRHRRWKAEASGALVIDDEVRRISHCCPRRECIFKLVESRIYGFIRSSMAVLVTAAYCLFTPMIPNLGYSWMNTAICYWFVFTAAFFLIEMVLQQVALGYHYFRIPWSYVNMVATALLSVGCFGIFYGEQYDVHYLEVCRFGLTFYIYQVLAKLPVIRVTFSAIMKSVPEVLEITIIVVFFMVTFSIVFIAEYKGKLGHCDLDTVNSSGLAILEDDFGLTDGVIYYEFVKGGAARSRTPCNATDASGDTLYRVEPPLDVEEQVRWTRQNCSDFGGEWRNEYPNFDNFGNSIIALFHLATTEGWVDLMQRCINAVGQDQHPMVGYLPSRAVAFVLYILVVAIFLTQLFATALVANFERLSQRESGLLKLTATQQEWLSTTRALSTVDFRRRTKPPAAGSCNFKAFCLAQNNWFKGITVFAVVVYLGMCITEAIAPNDREIVQLCTYVQLIAVFCFIFEIATKFAAFGRGFLVRWEQTFGFTPDIERDLQEHKRKKGRHQDGLDNPSTADEQPPNDKDGGNEADTPRSKNTESISSQTFADVEAAKSAAAKSEAPTSESKKPESKKSESKKSESKKSESKKSESPTSESKKAKSPHRLRSSFSFDDSVDVHPDAHALDNTMLRGLSASLADDDEVEEAGLRAVTTAPSIRELEEGVDRSHDESLGGSKKRSPQVDNGTSASPPPRRKCLRCRSGRRRYLHIMNMLDFLSVVFCGVSVILDLIFQAELANGLRSRDDTDLFFIVATLFRVLRLLRIVSLLRKARTIRRYLVTLGHSLIAVGNIVILFFVLINTFALIMREFFHFVEVRPDSVGGLEPHAHFQSWLQSFSVMARSTTGEAWHKILYDLTSDTPGCQDVFNITAWSIQEYQQNLTFEEAVHLSERTEFGELATNGCHSEAAYPLIVIFIYLSAFVMMNVFLAVVLDAFGAHSSESKGLVTRAAFDGFVAEWRKVDVDMDLFVSIDELLLILTRAPEPLGVGATSQSRQASEHLEDVSSRKHVSNALQTVYGNLNVSLFKGRVYFYDILTELLRVKAVEKARSRGENHGLFFQSRAAIAKLNAMDAVLFRKLKDKWYLRLDYAFTLRQALAAVVMQKLVRGYLLRKQRRNKVPHGVAERAQRVAMEEEPLADAIAYAAAAADVRGGQEEPPVHPETNSNSGSNSRQNSPTTTPAPTNISTKESSKDDTEGGREPRGSTHDVNLKGNVFGEWTPGQSGSF